MVFILWVATIAARAIEECLFHTDSPDTALSRYVKQTRPDKEIFHMAKYTKRKPINAGDEYDKAFPVPSSSFLFVYDGLMHDLDEHSLLKDGGAKFMVYAMTKKHDYTLHDFRDVQYAAAVEGGKGRIAGEVYKVDAKLLRALDVHQHNGRIFERKLVKMNGFRKKCWMYTYVPDVDHSQVDQMFLDKNGKILYDYRALKGQPTINLVKSYVNIQPSSLQIWREACEIRSFKKDTAAKHLAQEAGIGKNSVQETIVYTNTKKIKDMVKATKMYNPNIVLEDGTMVNKDKLAYDLLTLTDWLEKSIRTKANETMTEEERLADMFATINDMRTEIRKLAVTNTIDYAPRVTEATATA